VYIDRTLGAFHDGVGRMELDPQSILLRYRRLADAMHHAIENGDLRDNDLLPSERELAEQSEVSRDTVRKAIQYLEERGVVYSQHGKGTFVAPEMIRRAIRRIDTFASPVSAKGESWSERLLLLESVSAAMGAAAILGVAPGHPLTRVRRVCSVERKAVAIYDHLLLLPPEGKLSPSALARAPSFYGLLETLGFSPAEAVESLSVVSAETEDAALLAIATGDPVLRCERICLSHERKPIEYCVITYGPNYRYVTRIPR
jgi:GntR family transcriptional regulator